MTPYELTIYINAYKENKKAEREDNLVIAYMGAYLQRVKKMPSLKDLLRKKEQVKKQMTPEEILNRVKMLNEALGGTTY